MIKNYLITFLVPDFSPGLLQQPDLKQCLPVIKYINSQKDKVLISPGIADLVIVTLPVLPIGNLMRRQEGLIRYFNNLQDNYGTDAGKRFEDVSIHSLPQEYADMPGFDEPTILTVIIWYMVANNRSVFICSSHIVMRLIFISDHRLKDYICKYHKEITNKSSHESTEKNS